MLRKKILMISICTAYIQPISAAEKQKIELEEIVVTAQIRSKSLQDVPVSISAIGGEKIQKLQLGNLAEVMARLPNVSINEAPNKNILSIRGIASGENLGFEESVGTFVDGIYQGRSLQSRALLLDVERVEVLRGPQGIYFGNNTIAGALNITTRKPGSEFEGYVNGLYGFSHQERVIEGAVSIPVSEQLKIRLAGTVSSLGGYVFNQATKKDEPKRTNWVGRMTAVWTPNENLDVTLKVEGGKQNSDGRTLQVVDCPPRGGQPAGPTCSGLLGLGFEGQFNNLNAVGGPAQAAAGGLEGLSDSTDIKNLGFSLTVNSTIGDHTLTSITGYTKYQDDTVIDGDVTALPLFGFRQKEKYDQFSQEIRFLSPTGQRFEYILGAYFQDSKSDFLSDFNISPISLRVSGLNTTKTQSWAAFGSLTWNITDRLRTTAGLRYSSVRKDFAKEESFNPPFADFIIPVNLNGKRKDTDFTPSVNVQFDVNENILTYVSFSQGFKAGGFDVMSVGPVASVNNLAYNPEGVDAYEAGLKTTLLGGAMEANIAIFRSNYNNLQVSTLDSNTFTFVVGNAARSITQGIEFEGRLLATESLNFNFSFALLDAYYKDYPNAQCTIAQISILPPMAPCSQDLKNKELQRAPDYSGNIGMEYNQPVGSDLNLSVIFNLFFSDGFSIIGDNEPALDQGAYYKFDVRIGLGSISNGWEISVIGKNLNNKLTSQFGNDLFGSPFSFWKATDRPRSIAIQGRVEF